MTEPDRTAPRIVLLGMMGSGKSSIGRELSRQTGWPFVDNDALVERATGQTARELLSTAGEAAMREAEAAALRTGISIPPPAIVATAAGTILDTDNRDRLARAGFVVWLNAPAEVLAGRAAGASHRPWLDDDPIAWFRRTLEERRELYAAIADLEIDTNVTRPDEAARLIIGAVGAELAVGSEHVDRA